MSTLTRRQCMASGLVALAGCASAQRAPLSPSPALAALERARGGRLGVAAIDTATGRTLAHRADERFAMCSTFKAALSAAVLRRVDEGRERLDREVSFTERDLLAYAPATRARVAQGRMTVAALCEAAVTVSDNTAANLLLRAIGGAPAFTAFLRTLGDEVSRLDREEPALNDVAPGDPRDTTTPRAMAENLRRMFLSDALSSASRAQLLDWHRRVETGRARLRAGLAPAWTLAHKTGTGERGATHDIGVAWPPGGAPVILAVYYGHDDAPVEAREAVIADVARIVSRGATP